MNLKKLTAAVSVIILIILMLPAAVLAASESYKKNSTGDAVKAIQAVLQDEGYYDEKPDGKFGTGTETAVKAFQKKNGLRQDGKVGTKTLEKMGLSSDDKVIAEGKTTASVYLRRGASRSHAVLFTLSKGVKIYFLKDDSAIDFYKIRTVDGIEGYIFKSYAEKNGDTAGQTPETGAIKEGKITNVTTSVNVREKASTDSRVLYMLKKNTKVYVIEVSDGWVKICDTLGFIGYCSDRYVEISGKTVAEVPAIKIPSGTLRRESPKGSNIVLLQERLKRLGYFNANSTGNFGSVTYNAVKAFQKANDLKDDGIAGKTTLNLLFSSDARSNGDTAAASVDALVYTLPNRILRYKDRGDDVKTMQERLKELGYLSASATGYFGTNTRDAVEKFQKENGLTKDGVAGTKTMTALYSNTAITTADLSADELLMRKIDTMIEFAKSFLGVKYVSGGNGPNKFDCSGYTVYVFKNSMDYKMTRTAYTQGYNNFGRKITGIANLKKGDLVFFNTNKNDKDLCDHVGIYIGDNKFIHCNPSGNGVNISNITDRWWKDIFSWGKRVFE